VHERIRRQRPDESEARPTHLGAVLVLDKELVLEHDHVPFALLVLHLGLERRTERVEERPSRRHGLVGAKESDPPEAGEDAGALGGRGEGDEGVDALEQGGLGAVFGADRLGRHLILCAAM
jgi:hypothetical protein